MENLYNGKELCFEINKTLGFDDKDGDIVCEIPAVYQDRPKTPLTCM